MDDTKDNGNPKPPDSTLKPGDKVLNHMNELCTIIKPASEHCTHDWWIEIEHIGGRMTTMAYSEQLRKIS